MENKTKAFESQLANFKAFLSLVGKAIGYGSELDYSINDYYIDQKWQVDGEHLSIGDDEEIYSFNISSYSAKGEKLYHGKIGGYFLVMAYQDSREFAEVFVLRTKNRVKD